MTVFSVFIVGVVHTQWQQHSGHLALGNKIMQMYMFT